MFAQRQKRGASESIGENVVAYFCAEYGITDVLPIYSGGLGVLAGDIVQEAARLGLPLVAIGLLYRKGYFHQYIDVNGQCEGPQPINPAESPLELMKDAAGETLVIDVPIQERMVHVQVWRYMIGENSLYLLDTDHWTNSDADRQITDQLYGGDQEKRIQQEIVLAIGGLRALRRMDISPVVYHMNEGHSAFLSLELTRQYLYHEDEGKRDVKAALAKARRHLLFTNHTIVPAGNDMFPADLVRTYLGKYAYESGIGIDTVLELGRDNDNPDKFSMTMLALRASRSANAVSRLHAKKAAEIWPEVKWESITNGVHLPQWVAHEYQQIWQELAPGWEEQASDPATWKKIRKVTDQQLWTTHQLLKDQLLDEIYARSGIRLDLDALTVVWARRFATYKRPDLLFADIERLKKLLFNADKPVQIVIAGKSHPADGQGKEIIKHIELLANYDLKHRAVFLDDYSISLAKFLVAGADVWLNTPLIGYEASGTSGMKAAANGVIQCTVPDGWAAEVDWYGLGYPLRSDKAEADLYSALEKKIVPTYYRRNASGLPTLWVEMMRQTIATVSARFNSQRMVEEYVSKMYAPAISDLVEKNK